MFRVFGSFYAVCTLVLWLGVAIRSILELKNLADISHNSLLSDKDTPHGLHEGEVDNTISLTSTIVP